jgi:hypothetical protein
VFWDNRKVTAVLLLDSKWHEVDEGSFEVGDFWFQEPPKTGPQLPTAARFRSGDDVIVVPLDAISGLQVNDVPVQPKGWRGLGVFGGTPAPAPTR